MKKKSSADALMRVLRDAAPMLREIQTLLRANQEEIKKKGLLKKAGIHVVC